MKLGVSGRSDMQRRVDLAAEVVAAWEKISGQVPVVSPGLADALDLPDGVPVDDMDVDVIVPVGGDGTILWTLMHNPEAKLLGVNDGELGYLTEIPPDDLTDTDDDPGQGEVPTRGRIFEGLQRLHEGDYFVETRCKLAVHRNETKLGTCTNEVVVKTARPSKILTFHVEADGHEIEDVRADGLIISTPTGSTSYALSAGGPLVHPELEAVLIVPLAPFRVSLRPIVLPATSTVRVQLAETEKEGVLALDGQVEHTLAPGDELVITRSDEKARFVRFEPHFYSRIRDLFG